VPTAGGTPRYRLRASLEPFFASDGDVYLLRGGAGREHVVRAPSEVDRALLRQLAREGVAVDPSSPAAARLAPLVQAGVVVPEPRLEALGASDAQRFARQLPYLEDFGDPIAGQRRLRAASVAILGCGGLGTWALGALASAGVGRFVLVDDDRVELSNLNRQILYGATDVGAAKVARAAAWLAAFDPAIDMVALQERIERPADLRCLDGCDALLLTADWPPYELARWVNDACQELGLPFIMAGQQPPLVKVGPTFIPGDGACFHCHEQRVRREYPFYDELAAQRMREPPEAATLGPASALIGALLALEVMHLLLGHRPLATHDRVLLIDVRTLQTRWESIARDAGCARCATA
jgi:bacteriocin biosynthesis cyclodehydratase domain-containing protein